MGWLSGLFNSLGGAGRSIGGAMGQMGGGMMNMFNGMGHQGGQTPQIGAQAAQGAQQKGGNSLFGDFNPAMTGAGLGVMGLGQMMNKPIHMPDFSQQPQVQALNNWQNQANHPLDPNVAQSIQRTTDIQNEQQLRNLRDTYKSLRPGTDYTTDSAYQRDLANLNRQMSQQGSDAMAQAQLSSNQQQLGNLTNMAQLGVGQQMGDANLQAQRQQAQNQMYGNIGSLFLQRGLGMPNFMNMFKTGQQNGF